MHRSELIVAYGSEPAAMTCQVLEAARIEELIPPGASIALKPNLVVSKPASSGATTHPEIVGAVVEYLRGKGFSRFAVMEGSWVGDSTAKAFAAAGYRDLAARLDIPLVDLQREGWKRYEAGGGLAIAVCDAPMRADFLINLPVLKGHCQTNLTCALKNLKGCMPDEEKSRFHELGLHEPIARLNRVLRPGFVLVDAICGDLDFEEGGSPVPMGRLIAGLDPVLVDAYACRLTGRSLDEVPYIGLAEKYGVGSTDLGAAEIRELGDKESAPAPSGATGRAKALSSRIEARAACSACQAALVHGLARLEEKGRLKALDRALSGFAEKKIAIGRGFRGASWSGVGFGACAGGALVAAKGCPPDGTAAADFLEDLVSGRSED